MLSRPVTDSAPITVRQAEVTALRHALSTAETAASDAKRQAFRRGIVSAVAAILSHGARVETAAAVLDAYRIRWAEIAELDLTEKQMATLRKVRAAAHHDLG